MMRGAVRIDRFQKNSEESSQYVTFWGFLHQSGGG
jgi:hypothetical protein